MDDVYIFEFFENEFNVNNLDKINNNDYDVMSLFCFEMVNKVEVSYGLFVIIC